METNDLVERAEAIIDRAVKRTPPGKGDSYVLTWEQAVAAVLDALAGIEALQARVAELEAFAKSLSGRDDSIGDDARAALSPAHQEGQGHDG